LNTGGILIYGVMTVRYTGLVAIAKNTGDGISATNARLVLVIFLYVAAVLHAHPAGEHSLIFNSLQYSA
jgi:hypothetical protein